MLASEQYREAAELLERLRQDRPGEVAALTNLGLTYRAQGEFDKSIAASKEALTARPDHYPAHYELAVAYAHQSRQPATGEAPAVLHDRAMEHVERGLALNPTLAEAHSLRGGLLAYRNDFARAADSYRRAARLDPANTMNLYLAAMAHYQIEQWQEAADALGAVTTQDPTMVDALHLLGLAQMKLGRLDAAQRALERARELSPGNRDVRAALRRVRREASKP